ncbi:carboxymuconolactone decarboxylase family protein [Paracoccus marinus]|uniref:carboxymuconolactone decarboxylase family protein n=1 Tax=Paracoccus marinus TaxID=288426 RepID=UPI00103B94F6|nr:carboxymuconolactone decarboxylase family protein [Paracoccus marinus]GLS81561.1 alkyl hydroperoxide reductase AhpD [Paracoccus marinus]
MSRLPLRTIEDAPAEAQPRLEAAQKNNGFLPNLVRLLANAPVALETYQTVGEINGRASLTLAEREAVQITAAATHGCGFCVAGHTAVAEKKAKLDQGVISALRDKAQVPDARLDAVARFTEAVIASRGAVSDAELAGFKDAGFDDQAALEVVLGVSLATLCNFANNMGQPELNPQLAAYEWKGAAQAAAAE